MVVKSKLIPLLFVLVLGVVAGQSLAQIPKWQSRGIGGGGALYSCSISPHNSNTIFMATDMTGVFRSNNFGASWYTLGFLQLRGGVDTAVRFTSDARIVYAINVGSFGERIPVRSVNSGASFVPLTSDPTSGEAFTLLADPNTTNRLLLASWDKLYFSDDSGANFRMVFDANDPNNGLHLAGAFWDEGKIYVGTNRGMLYSGDFGQSFSLNSVSGIPATEGFVSFAGAKNGTRVRLIGVTFPRANIWGGITGAEVVAGENTPKVYRLNVGRTWARVRNFDSSTVDKPYFVGMATNDLETVYLAGTNRNTGAPSVLKSTNGGTIWTSVLQTESNGNVATGWMGDGGDLEWYWGEVALGFAVCPNNSAKLIVTDYGFVHVSANGGQGWKQAYVKPFYQNPAGQPAQPGNDFATAGVEQTSCWSIQWATPSTMIVGFSDIHGIRSVNSGQSWTSGRTAGLPHNSTYHLVQHPTNFKVFAATSSVHDLYQSTYLQDSRIDGGTGMIVVSDDLGGTWNTFYDFGHPVVWLTIDPNDSKRMFASVVHHTDGGIFVCNDISQSPPQFTRLSNPPRTEGHPMCIHVLNDGSLVCSFSGRRDSNGQFTQSSGVFISSNGGQSWLDRTSSNMKRWVKDIVIDPHDPSQNTWYAAVFSHWGAAPNEVGGVFRSSDRGQTWTELGDFYRVESITVDPLDANKAFVTTEADGLWVTTNLRAAQPIFKLDRTYPFQHPVRVFYNPWELTEPWVTSFGGGLRVLTNQ